MAGGEACWQRLGAGVATLSTKHKQVTPCSVLGNHANRLQTLRRTGTDIFSAINEFRSSQKINLLPFSEILPWRGVSSLRMEVSAFLLQYLQKLRGRHDTRGTDPLE